MLENSFSTRIRPMLGKSSKIPWGWFPSPSPECSPPKKPVLPVGFASHIKSEISDKHTGKKKYIFPDMMYYDVYHFKGVTS